MEKLPDHRELLPIKVFVRLEEYDIKAKEKARVNAHGWKLKWKMLPDHRELFSVNGSDHHDGGRLTSPAHYY